MHANVFTPSCHQWPQSKYDRTDGSPLVAHELTSPRSYAFPWLLLVLLQSSIHGRHPRELNFAMKDEPGGIGGIAGSEIASQQRNAASAHSKSVSDVFGWLMRDISASCMPFRLFSHFDFFFGALDLRACDSARPRARSSPFFSPALY